MKFDFNIRPAAEMPAREALRPLQVNEIAAPTPALRRQDVACEPSRLNLLARRQERRDRRANR